MRRSLAPSQIKANLLNGNDASKSTATKSDTRDKEGSVLIQRLPLLPFLNIPDHLRRSFVLPKGCVLTEQSLALRKIKTLGPKKNFQVIKPGEFKAAPLTSCVSYDDDEADDNVAALTASHPVHEPLVLWQDPNDDTNKVEVVSSLACKLRPHQREGVQFLFECTMGLRGFEGNGCLLADDMGLGKTLMSITVMWTLLQQGFVKGVSAVRKVLVVCPTSLGTRYIL
jgi:DNA repair and recombination RAD54-like protein